MLEQKIEQLGHAAYHSPLKPTKLQTASDDVTIFSMHALTRVEKLANHYMTLYSLAICDERGAQLLDAANIPAAHGKEGHSVAEFCGHLWEHHRRPNSHRITVVLYQSEHVYSFLNLHELDERVSYNPCGADGYALHFIDKKSGVNVEFIDIAAFFADAELVHVCEKMSLDALPVEPREPKHANALAAAHAYTVAYAERIHTLFSTLRAQFLRYGVDCLLSRTPASVGAKIYTTSYLREAVGMTRKQLRLQAMRSYWGGRSECFARGHFRGEFAVYDAQGLFPASVLALGELPRASQWLRLTRSMLHSEMIKGGLVSVEFRFPADELHPCLPVTDTKNQIVYPLTGTSHCTLHEVRYAIECGAEIKLLDGWGYMRGDSSLAEFSRDMIAKKDQAEKEGRVIERQLYKGILNAMYGKLGQARAEYDLNQLRKIARALNMPHLGRLLQIPNWEQLAEKNELQPEKTVTIGGQFCPEWAALILGYARYIESRAMREYVALTGTIDSVVIPTDIGPEFYIEGVKFRRECVGDEFVSIRAKFYGIWKDGQEIKTALHGAPDIPEMRAALLAWGRKEEDFFTLPTGQQVNGPYHLDYEQVSVTAPRIRKLREGLTRHQRIGKHRQMRLDVPMNGDKKREYKDNYSEPHWDMLGTADPE